MDGRVQIDVSKAERFGVQCDIEYGVCCTQFFCPLYSLPVCSMRPHQTTQALSDGQSHVPYRDAKLTRVLEESLGGNSRTCLIICCAPELNHSQETISTLRYVSIYG